MQTIQQQVKINFSAIELQDAIKAVALMDSLKEQLDKWAKYNEYNNLSDEEKKNTEKLWKPNDIRLNLTEEQTKALFELLLNIGFCTSY